MRLNNISNLIDCYLSMLRFLETWCLTVPYCVFCCCLVVLPCFYLSAGFADCYTYLMIAYPSFAHVLYFDDHCVFGIVYWVVTMNYLLYCIDLGCYHNHHACSPKNTILVDNHRNCMNSILDCFCVICLSVILV